MVDKVLFSSKKQGWGTPPDLWSTLNNKYNFQLDAATNENNPLNTKYYYTEEMDGLAEENKWVDTTYVNPPYGKGIIKWVERANDEQMNGVTTVMLVPARVDTKWFHEYVYHNTHVTYTFFKGRLKMFDYETHSYSKYVAPFPSMLIVFRKL